MPPLPFQRVERGGELKARDCWVCGLRLNAMDLLTHELVPFFFLHQWCNYLCSCLWCAWLVYTRPYDVDAGSRYYSYALVLALTVEKSSLSLIARVVELALYDKQSLGRHKLTSSSRAGQSEGLSAPSFCGSPTSVPTSAAGTCLDMYIPLSLHSIHVPTILKHSLQTPTLPGHIANNNNQQNVEGIDQGRLRHGWSAVHGRECTGDLQGARGRRLQDAGYRAAVRGQRGRHWPDWRCEEVCN